MSPLLSISRQRYQLIESQTAGCVHKYAARGVGVELDFYRFLYQPVVRHSEQVAQPSVAPLSDGPHQVIGSCVGTGFRVGAEAGDVR